MPDEETDNERARRLFERASRIQKLVEDVGEMGGGLTVLASELRTERYWRRRFTAAASVLLVVLIAAMAFMLSVARSTNEQTALLLDCTTPSADGSVHVCFERTQGATNRAISLIVDEVDRRTCLRMEQALETALERDVQLDCLASTSE